LAGGTLPEKTGDHPSTETTVTMVSWEWDQNYVPPVKLGLHCAQIVLSFVLWCLAIAVFAGEDSRVVGTNGWTFGVVSPHTTEQWQVWVGGKRISLTTLDSASSRYRRGSISS
jgi:hypothetical protein